MADAARGDGADGAPGGDAADRYYTPGTILLRKRDIARRRWGRLSRQGRSGRPPTHRKVRSVVLRLARENESWGYGELAGSLQDSVLTHRIGQVICDTGPGAQVFRLCDVAQPVHRLDDLLAAGDPRGPPR
jgi:hypothetical protein